LRRDAQSALDAALAHHRAGRLGEAQRLYQNALELEPRLPDAHFLLGVIAQQTGSIDAAIERFERAVQLAPDRPAFRTNLGDALRRVGRLSDAVTHLVEASQLRPDLPEPVFNLGLVMEDAVERDLALLFYEGANTLKPGVAAIEGKLQRARDERARSVVLVGQNEGSRSAHERLSVEAWQRLATYGQAVGWLDAAVRIYDRALVAHPGSVPIRKMFGATLLEAGRLGEATRCLEEAARLEPRDPELLSLLAEACITTGRMEQAVALLKRCLELGEHPAVRSLLVHTLNYHVGSDDRAIAEEARQWDWKHGAPLAAHHAPFSAERSSERRLRVGYVSAHFSKHGHRFFLRPLFQNHDRERFEIFCYANVAHPDEETEHMRSLVDRWREIRSLDDDEVAALVRKDGIDILVDLEMHAAGNRLLVFARKPAPVQLCWLAYPGTTGLSAMDYRITDRFLDPPDQDGPPYAERSIRLADSFWCYAPLAGELEVGDLPADRASHITFGCLNDYVKINHDVITLWAQLLLRIPTAHLVLLVPSGELRDRVLEGFRQDGIDGKRVELVGRSDRSDYLASYRRIDIALDPFPCGGHTTSLDALWMGVPVVTLRVREKVVGRAGVVFANNLGLTELIAESPEDYLRIASELAHDLPRLRMLRGDLRRRMETSPLMDGPRFARSIEEAYRNAWLAWCASGL
jgi:predicted O-linked N-acetylglucosamine transferase (SPINDLY family)